MFLSSGERQRFHSPAQDPSQPLGKIVHLTLEGKPAAGNPQAGRAGAASVTVTDPPRNTVAAKSARGADHCLAGGECNARRDLEQRPPQSATASPSRPTGGCGKPKWVRGAATKST